MAEIRQLRYFIAAAERLSFSQAALDLHISQPALSEAIRKLEAELGAQLLERSSRRVSLTPAGETLLHEGREAVAGFDRALAQAQEAARGRAGRLRVGFEATGAGALNSLARARLARRFPHVRVEPKRLEWGGEVEALRNGECDIAFVWLPADSTGLNLEVVAHEDRFAGLAVDHPLAGRAVISIDELNREPIMWTRRAPRFWVDWWAVNPRPDGSEPTWGPVNDNMEEMLEHVAAGAGYCLGPRSVTEFYRRPDLAWVPISDVEPLRIALGWRADETSPLVSAFAEIVRELAGET
jgi:DNA-binding transcriptional LysR family regulator